VPKKPLPAAAVTGVLRLSSTLSKASAEDLESSLSREVSDNLEGLKGSLFSSCGDEGGEVAVGGEKHKRLSETQGSTRAFFRSGNSGLDPGLGKGHSVNTGSSIILILVTEFSPSVLEDDSDSAEHREEMVVSTGVTGEPSNDNDLSTI